MKVASVTELKNGLSAYLEKVQCGHRVVVTDHHRPVAMLEKVPQCQVTDHFMALAARGMVALPKKTLDIHAFLAMPKGHGATSLVSAVSEDRDGR